tara:strand:- start:16238 stop:17473 length:1236 start_codon:yes stop_codon:yes gene_type:complete
LNNTNKLSVLIPRSLCNFENVIDVRVNFEGLSPAEISWENGHVSCLEPIKDDNLQPTQILLPRFVESHAHFDKSFSWLNYPNLKSNYENALSVNLEEHITRTADKVINRAEKSVNLAIKNGYRAIRTHVDTYVSQDKDIWPRLIQLREKFSNDLYLQFVALAQLEFWSSDDGELFAKNLEKDNVLLGGVIVPPFNKQKTIDNLSKLLLLANKYNLEIDLHIDESSNQPGSGIKILLSTIEKLNCNVPVTCSHSSSILCLKNKEIEVLAKKMAEKNIKVIALPLTNFWLLNRSIEKNSLIRPVAPVKQLQKSFIDVSIGSDNVQDPWYPFGNFDPFYLMSHAIPMLQLNPWDRLTLSALFNAPSRLLNLKWDGVVKKGCPADFVVVEGTSWKDLFSGNLKRNILIKGKWLKK